MIYQRKQKVIEEQLSQAITNGKEIGLSLEVMYGGLPGRPHADGIDGHSWWPGFVNIPTEYLETYYPLLVNEYHTGIDTGGAGKHRGGNCNEKVYTFLASGNVSIHDDRAKIQPWGINGGEPGQSSSKQLVKKDGTVIDLPSKIDHIEVEVGDVLYFNTAGSGGFGDPLERNADYVCLEVQRGLVSKVKAYEAYGVVLNEDLTLNIEATNARREEIRTTREALPSFNFGQRQFA